MSAGCVMVDGIVCVAGERAAGRRGPATTDAPGDIAGGGRGGSAASGRGRRAGGGTPPPTRPRAPRPGGAAGEAPSRNAVGDAAVDAIAGRGRGRRRRQGRGTQVGTSPADGRWGRGRLGRGRPRRRRRRRAAERRRGHGRRKRVDGDAPGRGSLPPAGRWRPAGPEEVAADSDARRGFGGARRSEGRAAPRTRRPRRRGGRCRQAGRGSKTKPASRPPSEVMGRTVPPGAKGGGGGESRAAPPARCPRGRGGRCRGVPGGVTGRAARRHPARKGTSALHRPDPDGGGSSAPPPADAREDVEGPARRRPPPARAPRDAVQKRRRGPSAAARRGIVRRGARRPRGRRVGAPGTGDRPDGWRGTRGPASCDADGGPATSPATVRKDAEEAGALSATASRRPRRGAGGAAARGRPQCGQGQRSRRSPKKALSKREQLCVRDTSERPENDSKHCFKSIFFPGSTHLRSMARLFVK